MTSPQGMPIPMRLRRAILDAHEWKCHYCGGAANSVDHIIPGGAPNDHPLSNLIAACSSCNVRKGRWPLEEDKLTAALAVAARISQIIPKDIPTRGATDAVRIHLPMPDALLKAIDKWRYANEVPSRTEAIRTLLAFSLPSIPPPARKSKR